jgi:hypothetical protein
MPESWTTCDPHGCSEDLGATKCGRTAPETRTSAWRQQLDRRGADTRRRDDAGAEMADSRCGTTAVAAGWRRRVAGGGRSVLNVLSVTSMRGDFNGDGTAQWGISSRSLASSA